jgi:hypothetical protein
LEKEKERTQTVEDKSDDGIEIESEDEEYE